MPLKTDIIEDSTLNLTPMVDIVFLLIIFFMVGTQFAEQERQFDIELPTVAEVQPLTNMPDEMIINVSKEGTIVVSGEQLTMEQLETRLIAARKNYRNQAVTIRGDANGKYQLVMDVLAVCNRSQIRSISLANRIEQE